MTLRLYRVAPALLFALCSFNLPAHASGPEPALPDRSHAPASVVPSQFVSIPGPLSSFLRLAGISQKAPDADVIPFLTRNIYLQGYQVGNPTEFLRLLDRYLSQARELQILAGSASSIHVTNCSDAGTLLQILGYRLRDGCGQKVTLETANPERAFLTIDSGFPLIDLEEALQSGTPFNYPYKSTQLPILFRASDWASLSAVQKNPRGNFLDIVIADPAIARLYWALTKCDPATRDQLQGSLGLRKMLPFGPALDFYGSQISIRDGRVLVPGGTNAEPSWKALAGASPESPGDFVAHLLEKDTGWLAAYFDVLSRVSPNERYHLAQSPRLQKLYEAFHSANAKESASIGVFRQGSDLLILDSRVSWEANGDPHVPGGVAAWKEILDGKTSFHVVKNWNKHNRNLEKPEQVIEAMTAFARVRSDSGPLQLYLTLSEIDRRRPAESPISPETAKLMAGRFNLLSNWYLVFSEFPGLTDQSIAQFITAIDGIGKISNSALHGNALGAFQANLGLWEILARQHEIPDAAMNASWQQMISPFTKITSATQLFDATRTSINEILLASGAPPNSQPSEIIDRLAGPAQQSPDGQRMHDELASRMHTVLDDQRLVSLDTLFALSDGLADMAKGGAKAPDNLLSLAGELREFEMPRQIFTNTEKVNWAPNVYTSHHAELQVQTDLTKVIKTPGTRAQLEAARGELTPFLRDTLVGLNYAYYEPPGAQLLHINPLFVRSHDFLGVSIVGSDSIWQPPILLGAGMSAGGGAYLMGSLTDLPFSLAAAEADFIVPESVQALIWKELVPDLLAGASDSRWWNVSPEELHVVALHQQAGEELLKRSVVDPELRTKVLDILSLRMDPQRLEQVAFATEKGGDLPSLFRRLMPEDTFYLTAEYRIRYPEEAASFGPACKSLQSIAQQNPEALNWQHLSRDFGVSHRTLAHTNAHELLNLRVFPYSGGYTSRLFSESLESDNLYWARLADEQGYAPVMLNRLVPELTRHMIGKIFATDLEDWPAIIRAMRETGDDLRDGKIASLRNLSAPQQAANNAQLPTLQ